MRLASPASPVTTTREAEPREENDGDGKPEACRTAGGGAVCEDALTNRLECRSFRFGYGLIGDTHRARLCGNSAMLGDVWREFVDR